MIDQILNFNGNPITDQDIEDIFAENGEKFITRKYGFDSALRKRFNYINGVFEWTEHVSGYRFFFYADGRGERLCEVEAVCYPIDRKDGDLSAFVEKMNSILSR